MPGRDRVVCENLWVKTCSKCRRELALEAFGSNRANRDGRDYYCRACRLEQRNKWIAEHPEKARTVAAKSRAKHRDQRRADSKRWREENPEYNRQRLSTWHAENRERRSAYNRGWARRNRERRREYMRDYYERNAEQIKMWARIRKLTPDAQDYAEILVRDPCAYCGEPTEQIDHIDPVALGGTSDWDNLTGACQSCNARKEARPLLVFLAVRAPGRSPGARH